MGQTVLQSHHQMYVRCVSSQQTSCSIAIVIERKWKANTYYVAAAAVVVIIIVATYHTPLASSMSR